MAIVTHDGFFHADEVFAVAVLSALFPDEPVVRTRNPTAIAQARFVVDVGGVWDRVRNRYDHHQPDFTRTRISGTPYASAGLVWEAYGAQFVAGVWRSVRAEKAPADLIEGAVASVDSALVEHLDAIDTGYRSYGPAGFSVSGVISRINPTWLELAEAEHRDSLFQRRFTEAVQHMRQVLDRAVLAALSEVLGECRVLEAPTLREGAVLVLPEGGLPWYGPVCRSLPEVRLVVHPDSAGSGYTVRTVPVEPGGFMARMDLPAAWAGLRAEALRQVTGVPDAIFCHKGRFIAGAGTLEGALRLAGLALDAQAPSLARP